MCSAHTLMNKMNYLNRLVCLCPVSLDMQMDSEGRRRSGTTSLVFPSITALHNQGSVAVLKGDRERWRILLLLVVDVKQAKRIKEGRHLGAAAVKDLVTRPDLGRSVCHRSDPADFKMAAIQVTAKRRCAADKRTSSLMPKHTRAYFVPTPAVVPEELLNHCVWRVLKNTPLSACCISLWHTWTRIIVPSPITGRVIFKNIAACLVGATSSSVTRPGTLVDQHK